MTVFRACSIPDCGNRHFGRGYCNAHYARLRKLGCLPPVKLKKRSGEAVRFFEESVLPYDGDECLMWPYSRNVAGYGIIYVGGTRKCASRHLCEEVNGPPPTPEHQAAHACGNSSCVTKRHLSWKTRSENEKDKLLHGTHQLGERNNRAKLTAPQVLEILALKGKKSQSQIARIYGVHQTQISLLHRGKIWGWMHGAETLSQEHQS